MQEREFGVCPFCGGEYVAVIWFMPDLQGKVRLRAQCPDCGSSGPEADTYEAAKEAWEAVSMGGTAMKERKISTRNQDHLCGANAIAETFGVSRATVYKWKDMGAPIFNLGNKHQASYPELWGWLKLKFAPI